MAGHRDTPALEILAAAVSIMARAPHVPLARQTCRYAPRPGDLNADRGLRLSPGTPVTPA
jgi:hypothetical protein